MGLIARMECDWFPAGVGAQRFCDLSGMGQGAPYPSPTPQVDWTHFQGKGLYSGFPVGT